MNPSRVVASLNSVEKVFGSGAAAVQALSGVTLEVYLNEVLLLMGPSGSGKTTLLSIIGCILSPSAGSIYVCGQEVTRLPGKDLARLRLHNVGFVFQEFNLLPALSAVENVEIPLHLESPGEKQARARALHMLESVGLRAKSSAFAADLSGGEKQRIALARALIRGPKLLLADEPTAALDFRYGRTVLELLRDSAHSRHCAVVIVSHDDRAREFADRILYLEDGRLAGDGCSTIR